MKKPVIGITLDFVRNSTKYHYSSFPWYALRQNYIDSITRAGGVPIAIPYNYESLEEILALIDGIVIPGGGLDLHPKHYKQEVISDKVVLNEERSNFELALAKLALEKNIPFLGICNGMQLLNVICGGSLHQHLPDVIKSDIEHVQPSPKNTPSHLINILPNTMLSRLANNKIEVMVNSNHHQGIHQVGKNLTVSAIALDGVVEAIELPGHKFAIGVEWHPEYLETELDFNIFKELISSCK